MKTKEMKAMTVRMDPAFHEQLTQRSKFTHRSAGAELVHLATKQLDEQTRVLKAEQDRVTARNQAILQDTGTTESP